jgi:hypothetical protein
VDGIGRVGVVAPDMGERNEPPEAGFHADMMINGVAVRWPGCCMGGYYQTTGMMTGQSRFFISVISQCREGGEQRKLCTSDVRLRIDCVACLSGRLFGAGLEVIATT